MSQELLFLIFLALEAIMLVSIYQLILLKLIRKSVVRHWIEEIESGRIDLPQVLESYTENLIAHIDALLLVLNLTTVQISSGVAFKSFTKAQPERLPR